MINAQKNKLLPAPGKELIRFYCVDGPAPIGRSQKDVLHVLHMSQTPHGQTPAQKPQPMHRPSSTIYRTTCSELFACDSIVVAAFAHMRSPAGAQLMQRFGFLPRRELDVRAADLVVLVLTFS